MMSLQEIISIVEKKISVADLKYKVQIEKGRSNNSVCFDIESNENIFVLIFWENGYAELTKLNKVTNDTSCDVFENTTIKSVSKILNMIIS